MLVTWEDGGVCVCVYVGHIVYVSKCALMNCSVFFGGFCFLQFIILLRCGKTQTTIC